MYSRIFWGIGFMVLGLSNCGQAKSSNNQAVKPVQVSLKVFDSAIGNLIHDELVLYLEKIFTNPMQFQANPDSCYLVIGTPQTSKAIEERIRQGALKLPGGVNADQGYTLKTIGETIYLAASAELGLLYGIYELLEAYGVYFQISGERLPAVREFYVKPLDVCLSPVFKYRGLLPWDNFLCGMSGYNPEDYRELIRRAVRMKFNMLQFHFYPGIAFFTETWNDVPVNPTFVGSPVDVFPTKGAVGKEAFGDIEIFGPKPYIEKSGNPRAQAEACQAMLREVIDYAHAHGFQTCVGFELMMSNGGDFKTAPKPSTCLIDPLDPNNAEKSVARYRCLVDTYPNSDFYWMWESEAQGWFNREIGPQPGHADMRGKYQHWTSNANAAGDIDYAYLFREVAKRLTAEERSRLATGGWSIEHIFPGMDKDFPEEVIFASLNTYLPPLAVNDQVPSYRVAQTGRRAWMIEWWEFDGGQWFPQFRANWQEDMYKQCVSYGVESVTMLGWKLSAIEHNVRYLSEFCWRPDLTAEDFYTSYVRQVYGPTAELLAKVFLEYDRYEPEVPCGDATGPNMHFSSGWCYWDLPVLPASQPVLEEETWKSRLSKTAGHIEALEKFYHMDQQVITAIDGILPQLDEQGASWLRLLKNRLQTRGFYIQMMQKIDEAVLAYDQAARSQGIKEARQAAAPLTQQAAEYGRLTIETYAREVRNRGDLGVIAQMNEQVYRRVKDYAASLGEEESAGIK